MKAAGIATVLCVLMTVQSTAVAGWPSWKFWKKNPDPCVEVCIDDYCCDDGYCDGCVDCCETEGRRRFPCLDRVFVRPRHWIGRLHSDNCVDSCCDGCCDGCCDSCCIDSYAIEFEKPVENPVKTEKDAVKQPEQIQQTKPVKIHADPLPLPREQGKPEIKEKQPQQKKPAPAARKKKKDPGNYVPEEEETSFIMPQFK